jgi:hypothetical protein
MTSTTPFAQAAICAMTGIATGSVGYATATQGDGAFVLTIGGVLGTSIVAALLAYFAAGGDQ